MTSKNIKAVNKGPVRSSSPELTVNQRADGDEGEKIVGFGVRMPQSLHEELRRISFESRDSINSLLLAGAKMAVDAYKSGKLKTASKST